MTRRVAADRSLRVLTPKDRARADLARVVARYKQQHRVSEATMMRLMASVCGASGDVDATLVEAAGSLVDSIAGFFPQSSIQGRAAMRLRQLVVARRLMRGGDA